MVGFLRHDRHITKFSLYGCNIDDKDTKEFTRLTSISSLDLHGTKISIEAVEALAKLTNLTSLDLHSNKISDKGIEALAKSYYLKFKAYNRDCEYCGDKSDIYRFLIKFYSQNKSVDNLSPDSIKKAVFNTARLDSRGETIEYVLERSDKCLCLINSKDEQVHTLFHFYSYNPRVQQLLLDRGLIPEKELERDMLQNTSQDR
ncbi:hypothetical protein [Wolbachia pipientis]|uniref:hypothetical protein n=1 Tax=Wolbachia pipientis TaxID=955 RepID=UPI0025A489C2|nr:hypothetical protein [Wolbachia pipientis]MDM8335391.1 hypothetical protein [Wolbachia pipientis]